MTLPIKPRVQTPALNLTFTPYLDGAILWDEGVAMFHAWAAEHFPPGKVFGDFELAEKLNVHRVISDCWLTVLVHTDRALDRFVRPSPYSEFWAPAFEMVPATGRVHVNTALVQDYDPWNDRAADAELPDALYADLYVDKFYDVTLNEHFIIRQKPRYRKNYMFAPLTVRDLPRYENSATARRAAGSPAPVSWAARIEKKLDAYD